MRLLFIIFLSFFISYTAYSCTCVGPSFCDYMSELEGNPKALIFKGTYLESEEIPDWYTAVKFSVDEIYHGEIVTPDSPHYNGEAYTNSEKSVWLLQGPGSACYRYYTEGATAIFAVVYQNDAITVDTDFGYVATICRYDYFPISEEETVTGNILGTYEWETMNANEFEALITDSSLCSPTSNEESVALDEKVNIYPQPTTDLLYIEYPDDPLNWDVQLMDRLGRTILHVNNPVLDLNGLETGMYFLKFKRANQFFLKKVVKI